MTDSAETQRFIRAFGRCLRAARTERGLSQAELARRAKIDRSYVSSIERGQRNITLSIYARLCEGLSVGLADLFECAERDQP